MSHQYVFVVIGSLLCFGTPLAVRGDPVVHFPAFELRAVPREKSPFISGMNSEFMEPFPNRVHQTIMHDVADTFSSSTPNSAGVQATTVGVPVREHVTNNNSTITIHDLLSALGIDDHEKHSDQESHGRAAARRSQEYGGYPSYFGQPTDYTYIGLAGQGYLPSTHYAGSSVVYAPPTYGYNPVLTPPPPSPPNPLSIFKPLKEKVPELPTHVKPVASKIANKIGGLIGLILSLLTGTSFDNLGELKALKDLVVGGIIKPLMDAKASIKSLIGKLTIPVLSLLLVNLEMLVVIWWLWEDCAPQPVHEPPVYSYPKPVSYYNYSPYK